jgi:hydantoinase/carbamoylase family amidase
MSETAPAQRPGPNHGHALGLQIDELARFTAEPTAPGVTREVFSPTYLAAVEYVRGLMQAAGLATRLDTFGNLFGRMEGAVPGAATVLVGSHIDTVPEGGRYDGVLGVLGAIEAIRMLCEDCGWQGRRPLEVICFAGEEPRFGKGCLGSRALTGTLEDEELERLKDRSGTSLAEAMRAAGLDPERLAEARLDPDGVRAFVELHIEQGRVLEGERMPIGVVSDIAAQHALRLILGGEAGHAGATPMRLRRDALAGAAEVIAAIERIALASSSGATVATVGAIEALPGAVNVVSGEVELLIDVRDRDLAARTAVVEAVAGAIERIATRRGLTPELSTISYDVPVQCDRVVVDAARRACGELELEFLEMTSGAVHDAMIMGEQVPTGMLFVPSRKGISHSPHEHTATEQIELGLAALARTLRILAEET